MDRRQLLGAAAAAMGGSLFAVPSWAAELDRRKKKKKKPVRWVILSDPAQENLEGDPIPPQLCYGGFLFSVSKTNGQVKSSQNKLLGASGAIADGKFTGTLLIQVPPAAHAAEGIPVVPFTTLSEEAQDTTVALNETFDVFAALIAPDRDALDQIAIAISLLDRLVGTINESENIPEGQKPHMLDGVSDGRGFLVEADQMIRQLPNNPSPEQLLAVGMKILQATQALQEAASVVLPAAPAG